MWGQETGKVQILWENRIIPTRVGTRKQFCLFHKQTEDHPHACGDKKCYVGIFALDKGSSPRVWGQVRHRANSHNSSRIIPTRVGTRRRDVTRCNSRWDHPHACGDKPGFHVFSFVISGSSPRVWGQVPSE